MRIVLYIDGCEKFIDRDAKNDYCRYAGECTIGCRECKYFEQKGDEQKGDAESEVD